MRGFYVILALLMTFGICLNAQEDHILVSLKTNYDNGTSASILPISEDVIALNVNSAEFWFLKAMCENQVGDFTASRHSLIKAEVNGYYNKKDLYFQLASVELKLGNEGASLNYVKEALESNVRPQRFEVPEFDQLKQNASFLKLLESHKPSLSIGAIIFLLVAFQGALLFGFLCFRKKGNNKANKHLGLFVLCFGLILSLHTLYKGGFVIEFPFSYVRNLWAPLIFALGPLLFFYIKDIFRTKYKLGHKLLHFIPFFVGFLYYASYHILNPEQRWYHKSMEVVYYVWLRNAHMLLYLYMIYKLIRNKKDTVDTNVARWLRYITIGFACFVVSMFLYASLDTYPFFYRDGWDYMADFFLSGTILLIGVFGIIQPQIFWGFNMTQAALNVVKYEKSGLTPSLSLELKRKLIALMIDAKVYKNNNLNLEELSEMLGTTKHNTSQIINDEFNENFFDFLNDFRIEEAKVLLLNKDSKMTISEILFEVGFNNKVTFNKAFKKRLGVTPTQFKRQVSQAI